jgi:hypothetical protein
MSNILLKICAVLKVKLTVIIYGQNLNLESALFLNLVSWFWFKFKLVVNIYTRSKFSQESRPNSRSNVAVKNVFFTKNRKIEKKF